MLTSPDTMQMTRKKKTTIGRGGSNCLLKDRGKIRSLRLQAEKGGGFELDQYRVLASKHRKSFPADLSHMRREEINLYLFLVISKK